MMDGSLVPAAPQVGAAYTSREIAFVREASKTKNDTELGALMGCAPHRIKNLRRSHGIPACPRPSDWTPEKLALLKRLYLDERADHDEIARSLGTTAYAALSKARRMGWRRPRVNAEKEPQPRTIKPVHDVSKAPVIFKAVAQVDRPLDERIMEQVRRRPLNAQAIATLIGEKELSVKHQLSAMRHAGQIVSSGEGRSAAWSAAS